MRSKALSLRAQRSTLGNPRNWRRASFLAMTIAIAVVLAFSAPPAQAQEYPSRPVRLVAGMAAGGGADANARRLAQILVKILKQNVVIQNVAGSAGNLAAQTVTGAEPDGYTWLFASHPIIAVNPVLYEKLPFNPDNLVPVVHISQTPHILLVNPSVPAANLSELVSFAKTKPGALNYGSGGAGTSIHLAAELLQSTAGISLAHVPYRGAAPAFAALAGNEIQLLFDSSTTAIGHVRGGRVRGLAIAAAARLPVVSDLPTFNESGLPGFEAGVGHGILAHAGTPRARIATLNGAINTALSDPEYRKQMANLGVVLVGGPPEQFQSFLTAERKKWSEVIRKRDIKVN